MQTKYLTEDKGKGKKVGKVVKRNKEKADRNHKITW